jgi:hypothetical protein
MIAVNNAPESSGLPRGSRASVHLSD